MDDATLVEFLESEITTLRAEIEQLRTALRRFGNHQMTCSYFRGKMHGTCDCGFDKALARPKDG